MCGIVCAFNIKGNKDLVRGNVLQMAQKKLDTEGQIGVAFTLQKMQYLPMRDLLLLTLPLVNNLFYLKMA